MKKRKKLEIKEFNLKKEVKESLNYIQDSKRFIYIAIGIFFFFMFFGFFIPVPKIIENQIMNFLRDLIEQTSKMSGIELISFIISNNLKSTFLGIILGFALGIFPLLSMIANGYLLGFVSSLSVNSGGILSLWRIFPHGIFELPAIFISLGLGLKFGTFVFQKKKINSFLEYLTNSLKVFLLIVLPLLILAGIIEGTLMVLFR